MRYLKLCFTFYRSFGIFSLVITLICASFFYREGVSVYLPLFWFKLGTMALVYFYMKEYKKGEFYYYKNLGVDKQKLWLFSFVLDVSIHLFVIVSALVLHYEKCT